MTNNICAKGIYCYITDNGLMIGDSYDSNLCCETLENTPNVTTEKCILLAKASKNSIDAQHPFVLVFCIHDGQAPHAQQFLYQSAIQFQPNKYPESFIMRATGSDNLSFSLSGGEITSVNAKFLVDILLKGFLTKCEEFQKPDGRKCIS